MSQPPVILIDREIEIKGYEDDLKAFKSDQNKNEAQIETLSDKFRKIVSDSDSEDQKIDKMIQKLKSK